MIFFANLDPSTVANINFNGADFERFVPYSINSFFLHNIDADETIKILSITKTNAFVWL